MQTLSFNPKNRLHQAGLRVVKLFQAQGYEAFWVGGIVRNILLKRESDNVDIATNASAEKVENILAQQGFIVKPIGKQFGSILAIVDGYNIEVTTFRTEGRYSDNRHPDQVEFVKDYKDDAQRRDFTVNALYFEPTKQELLDPTNGIKDLKGQLLRFVGDPKKRIDEDGLRMLRGVRLATQLKFKLEKNSFAAIKTRAKYIQDISGERVKAELDKILISDNRVAGLELLDKTGLMRFIIPQMEEMKKFTHKSKLYHLEGSMFDHTLLAISKAPKVNLDLMYAILFHDIGKPQSAKKVLKPEGWVMSTKGHADVSADIFLDFAVKYKFPRQNKNTVEWVIRKHMLQKNFWEMRTSGQMEIAAHPDFELLLMHWYADHYGNKRADNFDEHSKQFNKSVKTAKDLLKRLSSSKPLILQLARGELIMKYTKLKPGQALGAKIEDIKVQIVSGKIKSEDDLKKYLST